MSDAQARELLALLKRYVQEYDSCTDMSISEVADDLVISLDEVTDSDRSMLFVIKAALTTR